MSESDEYHNISAAKEFRFISEIIDGRFDIVKRLVEQKMDIEAKYYNGVTALMLASKYNHLDIIKYLIEQKADIEVIDNDGVTALMVASKYNHLDTVKYLIEQKADIEAKDNNEWTAIMVASKYDPHLDVVKYLTEQKANIEAKDRYGSTILLHCYSNSLINCYPAPVYLSYNSYKQVLGQQSINILC